MKSTLTITLIVRPVWEEGSGVECAGCGDSIYGRQLKLTLVTEDGRASAVYGDVFCQACGEAVAEQFES